MTYEPLKLDDRGILDIMMAARQLGITTMIHAENSDMIAFITERLEERAYRHVIPRRVASAARNDLSVVNNESAIRVRGEV